MMTGWLMSIFSDSKKSRIHTEIRFCTTCSRSRTDLCPKYHCQYYSKIKKNNHRPPNWLISFSTVKSLVSHTTKTPIMLRYSFQDNEKSTRIIIITTRVVICVVKKNKYTLTYCTKSKRVRKSRPRVGS